MKEYSYPADLFNEEQLDKTVIVKLIKKHFADVSNKVKCLEYYEGKHSILSYTRDNDSDNMVKIVCNHAKDITDTATGYFMGNPVTYKNISDEVDATPLTDALTEAHISEVDSDHALYMSIFGKSYEYIYADVDGNPVSKCISPLNTFIVVDDSIEENELFGVYYYEVKDAVNDKKYWSAVIATEHYIYKINLNDELSTSKSAVYITEEPEEHHFDGIPMIEILNNKMGIGDYEQQISLIDAYNLLASDRVTDKEQFIDALLVLYGTMLADDEESADEAMEKLRDKKLLELPADAKAAYLTRTMDESGAEILRKALKEDIYNFSHVPNLTDENFAGNSSGVAMEYKLLGLEMITKTKERYYRKAVAKRNRLYSNFLELKSLSANADYVIPVFSRSLPKNLLELAQTLNNLASFVSKKTLIEQLPFIEDTEYELEELSRQQEEESKTQQSYFSLGMNTVPSYLQDTEDE